MPGPVSLEQIKGAYVDHLVDILNNDHTLAATLSSCRKHITSAQFRKTNALWAEKNHAKMFAIVLRRTAIGMISLSHINRQKQTARIGYWLASSQWHKGYTSAAFAQILILAKSMGITAVSCAIEKDNAASQAIWAGHNAAFAEERGRLKAQLYL
jgi:RimJ/RimL family protein N-acetyltransferase